MLSKLAKLLLTSTAIAPVGFTYAWVAYRDKEVVLGIVILSISILLLVICLALLRFSKSHLEKMDFTATTIEAADRENMGFLLLYMLPLFTASFTSLHWDIWIPALIVFGLVVGTGYSYHFNPLLGLMGWHFYKVSTPEGVTYVLITKKQLRTANKPLTVAQLTEYIVIDIEGK